MSRKIKIIFTLSILMNVIFIGLVVGGGVRMYRHFGGEFKKELSSLPADVQARIDEVYESSRDEMKTLYLAAKYAKMDVRETLNSDEFDLQKYDMAMGKLNQVRCNMLEAQGRKTGKIASELDADNRRRFAGYLLRGGMKGHFKNKMQHQSEPESTPKPAAPVTLDSPVSERPAEGQNVPFDPVMLPMPDF